MSLGNQRPRPASRYRRDAVKLLSAPARNGSRGHAMCGEARESATSRTYCGELTSTAQLKRVPADVVTGDEVYGARTNKCQVPFNVQ